MQANLGLQKASDMLKSVYNLVKQHNPYLLAKRVLIFEENLQWTPPKDHFVCKATLCSDEGVEPETTPIGILFTCGVGPWISRSYPTSIKLYLATRRTHILIHKKGHFWSKKVDSRKRLMYFISIFYEGVYCEVVREIPMPSIVLNRSHWKWQCAVKKGNDDDDISKETETMSKNKIKNATFLFSNSNQNMTLWGTICYFGFFDLTINGK